MKRYLVLARTLAVALHLALLLLLLLLADNAWRFDLRALACSPLHLALRASHL
jgi:hypothetical protein